MQTRIFQPGQIYIDTKGNLLTITDVTCNVVHFHSTTIKTGCFDRSGTYFMINSAFAQTLKLINQ
jgi:hypothetical protein